MFRIEYLKLSGHPQLGNITLELSDPKELDNILKPYTSVIIGPNGTGKSFILRTIADILMSFNTFKTSGVRTINLPYNIHLRYFLDDNFYDIVSGFTLLNGTKKVKEYIFYKNSISTIKDKVFLNSDFDPYKIPPQELNFPQHVIANSILQTDRFLFRNSKPDDFYQYLGARSTSSTSSTKSSSRKTIKYLFNATATSVEFKDNLKELLHFLDFEKSLKIHYTTKINKLFFSGELTETNFRRYFEEWWREDFTYSKRSRDNPLWSIPHYNNIYKNNNEKIAKTVNYLNYVAKNKLTHKARSASKIFSIDLFDNDMSLEDFDVIRQLEQLDIINLDGIIINKNDSNLSLNDVSSGEFNLIISMIGIFSKIENSSLVLIDEPEISLHPNWQMQYVTFLKKVFAKYSSCQFIITSHSHFLISDLEGESSSVTALNRNAETFLLETRLILKDTFGWSAEEILYSVFNVRTTRNYYLENDMRELLHKIAIQSNETERMRLLLSTIEKISFSENDPINLIIKKAKEYLGI